jgi:glycosyltransferase involved in cell wall biosynthesis
VTERSGQTSVAVIPNFIPEAMLAHERPRRERLTVGWGGGVSHAIDMMEMADPLRRFLDTDAKEAEFHIVGSDFRGMTGHRHARCSGWENNPWDYYKNLDFDIGLAPLAPEKFNESKSWLKCLEYGALGIPVIASDFGPYHDYVIDGVTGFLVKSKPQWRDRLRMLASDADLRESMGQKAREQAAQHTIEGNWHRWDEVYRRLL